MVNEASFSVSGYVATQPTLRFGRDGQPSVSMRVGWTPRRVSKVTGEWEDLPSSFVSVVCFRKVAQHAAKSLHKGEPIVLSGTLQVREYTDARGEKRLSVDVVAQTLGHDMSRGITSYSKWQAATGMTAEEAARAEAERAAGGAAEASGPAAAPRAGPDQLSAGYRAPGTDADSDRDGDSTDDDLDDDADLEEDDGDGSFGELGDLKVPASPEGLAVPAGV
jgi:single-strand DNA-binding protein